MISIDPITCILNLEPGKLVWAVMFCWLKRTTSVFLRGIYKSERLGIPENLTGVKNVQQMRSNLISLPNLCWAATVTLRR